MVGLTLFAAIIGAGFLGGTAVYQGAKRGESWWPGKDMLQETGGQVVAVAAILIMAAYLLGRK